MDFFEQQESARRSTILLTLIVLSAMLGLIGLGSFVTGWGLNTLGYSHIAHMGATAFAAVFSLCLLGGTLFKLWRFARAGGSEIARELGGQLLLDPADPAEKQLLNIVEEMAIASGVPAPSVYLLDEPGINAFAAGFEIRDATIGVTRGAIEHLTRDEMQGVVAHEFAHLLNGDTRLNTTFSGLIFGLYSATQLGWALIGRQRRRVGRRGKTAIQLAVIGALFLAIGALGSLVARVIQSRISHQREYLADASAVQFTRNPQGIAMALNRIRWGGGSYVQHPNRASHRHLFFAEAD